MTDVEALATALSHEVYEEPSDWDARSPGEMARDILRRLRDAGWTIAQRGHVPSTECWCGPEVVAVPPA